ncbi:hypothetical protein ATK36_5302 [Amycolatopsis sulphurea]|uniref:Uncharacterized protein n=1 Tax=Amycolatopsis sulphurea TaxID=76022 RepID=A0A2A9FHW0_9PSEU|nr:hypothetical protein [Amycolatopsis sulphurea]PFG50100.1 hypothetical protein ATK36_5302 [Amycolatopsis sulphurea]
MDGRLPGGFGFPIGCTVVAAVAIVADLAGATEHPGYAVVPLTLVVFTSGVMTRFPAALGVTAVAWAVVSGFLYGRSGGLVFDGATGRLALVLFSALVLGGAVRIVVARIPLNTDPSPRRSNIGNALGRLQDIVAPGHRG